MRVSSYLLANVSIRTRKTWDKTCQNLTLCRHDLLLLSFTKSELNTPPTLDNNENLKSLVKVKILSYPFAFWCINNAKPLPIPQTQKQGERVKILYPTFTDFCHLWAVSPCQLKDCKDFQLAPVKNIYLDPALTNCQPYRHQTAGRASDKDRFINKPVKVIYLYLALPNPKPKNRPALASHGITPLLIS